MMVVMSYMDLTAVLILSLSALASEYADQESQLRDLVLTDPMTGLPNYRALVEKLTEEISRANRTDSMFAVVFCDMDGLKQINDELGHLIGSRAVCRFAETLRAASAIRTRPRATAAMSSSPCCLAPTKRAPAG